MRLNINSLTLFHFSFRSVPCRLACLLHSQYINKEREAESFRETGRIQAKRASQLAASFATSPSGKQVKAFLTTVFPKGANFDTVLAVFEKEKYRIDDL